MNKKILLTLGLLSLIANSYAQGTCATVDCIALGLIPQTGAVMNMLGGMSYIFGIVFGIKGAMKLKDYNESKGQQVKLAVPIVMLIAAACFLALPSYMNMGIEALSLDTAGAKKLGQF